MQAHKCHVCYKANRDVWPIIKGSCIHVQTFCTFDCYDILAALKQEVQFDAHEFHLALVLSLMCKADAQ